MAIIVAMMGLMVPAFNTIRGGNDFTSELYDISGTLDQARAYAMSNNTYVLVGFMEAPSGLSTSATQVSGTGRLTMAVVASKDGTRPYQKEIDKADFSGWTTDYNAAITSNGGFFTAVTKLTQFQNIHMVDLQSPSAPPPAPYNMARYTVSQIDDIPNAASISATPFAWPLTASLTSSPQITFSKVIEFNPQGTARIISKAFRDAIPQYIEIGLQPSHATIAQGPPPDQKSGQIAAIQIDGMSGASRIYRP